MLVPIPNAVTVDSVGLERLPFPFTVSRTETEWGTTASLTALRLADVADVLASSLRPHVLVCHAGHYVFETPDSNVIVSLGEVAAAGEVPEVREPGVAVLRQLLAKSPDWTAHPSDASVSRETVDLSLAAVPWRLGEFPTGQVDGVCPTGSSRATGTSACDYTADPRPVTNL